MYTQLYSENSTMILDFWFDKNTAKINIAKKFQDVSNEQGSRKGKKVFDYSNSLTVTMNMVEIQKALVNTIGLLNNDQNVDYNQPILTRKWENTITEFFISYMDSKPSIIIRTTVYDQVSIYDYKFNNVFEIQVLQNFLQTCLTIAPFLGSYYYWEKYMNNRNQNNFNQNRNNYNKQNNNQSNQSNNNFNNGFNGTNFTNCAPQQFNQTPQQPINPPTNQPTPQQPINSSPNLSQNIPQSNTNIPNQQNQNNEFSGIITDDVELF